MLDGRAHLRWHGILYGIGGMSDGLDHRKNPRDPRHQFFNRSASGKSRRLAEPIVIGGIMGTAIGLLAGDRPDEAFMLGIQMSAVMVLMPQIVKCIMEGLLPLSERAKKILSKRFGNGEFYK